MTPAELAAIHERAAPLSGWSPESFAGLLRTHGTILQIGEQGFALARQATDEAELLMIAVDPRMQRNGIGQMLLDRLFLQLRENGSRTLFLEVATSNAAARSLYAKVGFVQTAIRKAYYRTPDGTREDALVLQKTL
ncbi:MAG: ribosomal protein S18-alanine N-acetyltransferase [Pseudomonadota bacterium]